MELFEYDAETGIFRWRVTMVGGNYSSFVKARPGDIAGKVDKSTGYVRIRTHGEKFFAHRLAWLFVTGEWPRLHIDHKDGDKENNRFGNLRDVTRSVNLQNRKGPSKKNKSTGVLGVRAANDKFLAEIRINGKTRNLGRFDTTEQAHAAYLTAKRKFHEGCTT